MTRVKWPGTMLLAASLCAIHARAWAEDPKFSTGAETWTTDGVGTLFTKDWPIQNALKATLSHTLKAEDTGKEKKTKPKDLAPAKPRPQPDDSKPTLPDLKYGSDTLKTMLALDEPGKKVTNLINRSLLFDSERHAIRVLDVITNSEAIEQELSITYTTRWRPEAVPKLAKPRNYNLGKSTTASGVLLTTSGEPKRPILMLLFGAESKGWTRTLSSTADTLSWVYQGKLGPNQRILLLHWVALIPDAQTETLRKVGASLIAKGMPADDSLDEQALKELINYPVPGDTDPDKESAPASTPVDLYFLKALCKERMIERAAEHDQLVLKDGPTLKGDFIATDLDFKTAEGSRTLALAEIAAIQGGAGSGRKARVYFRNGTVASGALNWKDATLKDDLLGTVKFTPENLDVVVFRTTDEDQRPTHFAALWVGQDGDVRGMPELPSEPAHLRWSGGDLPLTWPAVVALRQQPPPDLGHEVVLQDGSRVRGWLTPANVAACQAYATTWTGLTSSLDGASPPQKITGLSLRTEEGSSIAGAWDLENLTLATGATELNVPTAGIRVLTVQHEKDDAPIVLEVQTSAGTTLKGRPVAPALAWKWNGKKWALPWSQISRVSAAAPDPAPAKP